MRRRPVMSRRGPGVLGTVARTAVIAGTATAASKAVSGRMNNAAEQRQQQQQAAAAGLQAQAELEQVKTQMAALQAQQVQAAAAPPTNENPDLLTQLERLGQLKQAGVLSEDEFQAAKRKLLYS